MRRLACCGILATALLLAASAFAQTSATRVYDTFTGPNGALLASHAPNTNLNGLPWVTTETAALPSWGTNNDIPVPGDYDGDGKVDIAVWRASVGVWWILKSSSNYTSYSQIVLGTTGDMPVPGDYDGDHRTDPAVYRPSTGQRWILYSTDNYASSPPVYWGIDTDIAITGDFDGDGEDDIGNYRPSTGQWWILTSSSDFLSSFNLFWGLSGDMPVPGDYDGDGKTDVAIFRPSNGMWYIRESHANWTTSSSYQWGNELGPGDVPVAGDYDGDHRTDVAVYRPSTGEWRILTSVNGYSPVQARIVGWGWSSSQAGFIVAPGDFDGDGVMDIAVFQPATGQWYVVDSTGPSLQDGEAGLGGLLPGMQLATIDAGSAVATNISVAATWRSLEQRGWGGVLLRYSDAHNFLLAYVKDGRTLGLLEQVGGSWITLSVGAVPAGATSAHRLRVSAVGTLIRVYWDNNLQFQVTDSYSLTGRLAGLAWMGSYAPTSRADDFQIDANVPPTVTVASPNGPTFTAPATIPLLATAVDADGSIAHVDFFADGAAVGVANQSPYTVTWSNVLVGTYTVIAKAYDNTGDATVSGPMTLYVCGGFSISPTSATFGGNGGTGGIQVTAGPGCTWTASTQTSWLHIAYGSPGNGAGILAFTAEANPVMTVRTGSLTVAGQTVTVTQDPAAEVVSYLDTDAIGSVRLVTNAQGQTVARYDYLPFGTLWPASSPSETRLFAGKERDSETDFDYFGGRYLSAGIGRFTSVDPTVTIKENLLDPQRWNRYVYVRNNPTRYVDPDGRALTPLDFVFVAVDLHAVYKDASWTNIAILTADIALALIPGAPAGAGQLVRGAEEGERIGSGLLKFTARNARENLARLTEGAIEGAHAHHIFPKQLETSFVKAGLNINDPRFLSWWEAGQHLSKAKEYNQLWLEFFEKNVSPSTNQILEFGQSLAKRYGLQINF